MSKSLIERVSGAVSYLTNSASAIANAVTSAAGSAKGKKKQIIAIAAAIAIGSMTAYDMVGANVEEDDPIVDSCSALIDKAADGANSSEEITETAMLENAKKIYSFFKTHGESDEQIAGILGCWQAESGINPTKIESFYGDGYTWSDEKEKIASDLNAYTLSTVFPHYSSVGLSINHAAYKAEDGKYYPGIGFYQATGPAAYKMISAAKNAGKDWHSFDWQLAYAIGSYRPGFFETEEWKSYNGRSVADCTTYILNRYEGCTIDATSRINFARTWLNQMKTWEVDKSYASSVYDHMEKTGDTATNEAVSAAINACPTDAVYGTYDNSSIALAASSLAWDTMDQARNEGVDLYHDVYYEIYGNNARAVAWTNRSCDIFVSTVVRWTGADDDFPARGPATQGDYMRNTSSKWEYIGKTSELAAKGVEMLQPGDILTSGGNSGNGHIFVYCGADAIAQMHPNLPEGLDSAHAAWYPSLSECRSGFVMASSIIPFLQQDGRIYDIYRSKKMEDNSKYTHIAVSSRPQSTGTSTAQTPAKKEESISSLQRRVKRLSDFSPNFTNTAAWSRYSENGKNPYPYGICTWFVWGCFYQAYGYQPAFGWTPSTKYSSQTWAYDCARVLAENDSNFSLSDKPAVGAIGSLGGAGAQESSHVIFVTGVSDDGKKIDYWEANVNQQTENSLSEFLDKKDYRYVQGADVESLRQTTGQGKLTFAVPNVKKK